MSQARVIDGAAPEVQDELDRMWMALDSLTRQLDAIETKIVRTQHAPAIEYTSDLPREVEACSCEEAVALRAEVAEMHRKFAGDVATFARLVSEKEALQTALAKETAIARTHGRDLTGTQADLAAAHSLLGEISQSLNTGRSWLGAIRGLIDGNRANARQTRSDRQCQSIDGGPMGTDQRCTLHAGHAGGCSW